MAGAVVVAGLGAAAGAGVAGAVVVAGLGAAAGAGAAGAVVVAGLGAAAGAGVAPGAGGFGAALGDCGAFDGSVGVGGGPGWGAEPPIGAVPGV